MYIVPQDGVIVRCPIKKTIIPPEGAEVKESNYWFRRLAEGSIYLGDPSNEEKSVNIKEAKAK